MVLVRRKHAGWADRDNVVDRSRHLGFNKLEEYRCLLPVRRQIPPKVKIGIYVRHWSSDLMADG
jgi:hypothetical protein